MQVALVWEVITSLAETTVIFPLVSVAFTAPCEMLTLLCLPKQGNESCSLPDVTSWASLYKAVQ